MSAHCDHAESAVIEPSVCFHNPDPGTRLNFDSMAVALHIVAVERGYSEDDNGSLLIAIGRSGSAQVGMTPEGRRMRLSWVVQSVASEIPGSAIPRQRMVGFRVGSLRSCGKCSN